MRTDVAGEGIPGFGGSGSGSFHPVIQSWFRQTFGVPTDVQVRAWKQIMAGRHTLIAAPTGSGKTLAALLPCLDRVVCEKEAAAVNRTDSRPVGVRVLYVTPLKALNNDIHAHVVGFAEEMERHAQEAGLAWPGLSVGVRTGDTSQSTRASMLRRPPDLLVTTPESLYLMLTSQKARMILKTVDSIIVDEIHDLASDRRGVHLSVSLERLVELCGRSSQRIGVSATQKPMERVARFLGGWADEAEDLEKSPADTDTKGIGDVLPTEAEDGFIMRPRHVDIVESPMEKKLEVLVTMPDYGLSPGRGKQDVWTPIVKRLLELMEGARSVLIFANSRRLCERLTLRLNDHVGHELARAHHGSVSREKRLEVERLLKTGDLRCIVATSSLELGIDVGHVDLVLQIDSPKSAAAGIQRIGRAGHAAGAVSRGIIVARSRGDLAEAAVLAAAIVARDIEEIRVPRHLLDVMSQQIVAMLATEDWDIGRLHRVLARSDCFRGYSRGRLEAALQVLAGFYPFAKPLIAWNRETGILSRTSAGGMAAVMGAGTIPSSSGYPVHHADTRLHLGELDEEFVHESRVGDVFQLGTSSWMIQAIKPDRIYVVEKNNRLSEIPFWRADSIGRSRELGQQVGRLLGELDRLLPTHIGTAGSESDSSAVFVLQEKLMREHYLDARAAEQLISLVRSQKAVSAMPTDRRIVVEQFKDDAGAYHLVIHSLFGKRFNRTWMLALQAELERKVSGRMYAVAKDNGIEFVMPDWDSSWLSVLRRVTAGTLDATLRSIVPGSPMLAAAFRRIAETSLLLTRGMVRVPMWKKRYRSEELLKEALPFAERFPYLREALDECLRDHLDADSVRQLLLMLERGEIEWVVKRSEFPSPLGVQYLNDFVNTVMYESDALAVDVKERLLGVSRELAAEWFGDSAARESLHPKAVEQERRRQEEGEEGRTFTGSEDVYRALKRYGDLTVAELLQRWGLQREKDSLTNWLSEMEQAGRIRTIRFAGESRWICADEADMYGQFPHLKDTVTFILGRYVERVIAVTPVDLAERYDLDPALSEGFIADWVTEGRLVRAPFAQPGEENLYTHERLASRMIRHSIRLYREETEKTTPERLSRHLAYLHKLSGDDRLVGSEGIREALARLEGTFLPKQVWESILLPSRVPSYRQADLDLLLASGEVIWLGKKEDGEKDGKIAFFLSDSKELYAPVIAQASAQETKYPDLLTYLKRKGAIFLSTLSRELGMLPSVLNDQLLELVWEGRIANDQFAPIRLSAASKTRSSGKFQSGLGRWYCLEELVQEPVDPERSAICWANRLLSQHVIVTKEHVKDSPYSWDTMAGVFKRLEELGMTTRGFLTSGADVLQFAAREAAEQLKLSVPAPDHPVVISAVDPANPYGLTVKWPTEPGASFARKLGHYVVLLPGDERLVWLENGGKRWTLLGHQDGAGQESFPISDDQLRIIMRFLLRHSRSRKLTIESWNGSPAADTVFSVALKAIGAERDGTRFIVWPSSLGS